MPVPIFPAKPISLRKLQGYRGTFAVLLVSDAAIFVTVFAVRFLFVGTATPAGANLSLGAATSALYLISAWFSWRALAAARREEQAPLVRSLRVVFALGVLALGASVFDWGRLDLDTQSRFGSSYILAMLYHLTHLVIGLITLLALQASAAKGRYSRNNHWVVEAGVFYWWSMVVVTWLVLFVLFYVI